MTKAKQSGETEFLTVRQTAAFLGVSENTVRRKIDQQELGHFRVGRKILIDHQRHISEYLRLHEIPANAGGRNESN